MHLASRYIQDNQLPFTNKSLSKEIMKKTRVRDNFLLDRTKENKIMHSKQRNYCLLLIRETKKRLLQ